MADVSQATPMPRAPRPQRRVACSLHELPKTVAEARATGAKRYYTGKPCRHGHVCERITADRSCIDCKREADIVRGKTNVKKAASRANTAVWRSENRDQNQKANAAWRAKNRDYLLAEKQRWYQANRERIRAEKSAWSAANRDIVREQNRAWRANNPEIAQNSDRNKRARRRLAEGKHTVAEVNFIRNAQGDKCAYCRTNLNGGGHLDHIVAIINGGSNWPRNLQWLCATCNTRKKAKDPIEFARSHGLLL